MKKLTFPPSNLIFEKRHGAKNLWLFGITETTIRFIMIGLLAWLAFEELYNNPGPANIIFFSLLGVNVICISLLLLFKHKFMVNFNFSKVFHYLSLLLSLVIFNLFVILTGKENSEFFLFFITYLTVIPLAQINFDIKETLISEAIIIVSYPLPLLALKYITNFTALSIHTMFLVLVALPSIIFSRLLRKEHKLLLNANSKLRNLAITDPLTGIFNRRFLQQEISREVARAKREGSLLSIAMADLDNFKKFNDEFGHLEGDKILSTVADIFIKNTRQMDIVARYGGEEFVILLPSSNEKSTCEVAERIRIEVEEVTQQKYDKPITITFGIATYPRDVRNGIELLNRADRALCEAKRAGKNRVNVCKGMIG